MTVHVPPVPTLLATQVVGPSAVKVLQLKRTGGTIIRPVTRRQIS